MQMQIDEDRWMPASRAAAIIREIDGLRIREDEVFKSMPDEDKRAVTGLGGKRNMVRFVKFRQVAKLVARAAPKPNPLADRVRALEAQREIDMRRIDESIEALQRQIDRSNDFTSILTK